MELHSSKDFPTAGIWMVMVMAMTKMMMVKSAKTQFQNLRSNLEWLAEEQQKSNNCHYTENWHNSQEDKSQSRVNFESWHKRLEGKWLQILKSGRKFWCNRLYQSGPEMRQSASNRLLTLSNVPACLEENHHCSLTRGNRKVTAEKRSSSPIKR